MRLAKCDRCGNIIFMSNLHEASVDFKHATYETKFLDLCPPCANGLIEFLKPVPQNELKK